MEKTEKNAEDEVDENDEEHGGESKRPTMATHVAVRVHLRSKNDDEGD